jgi:hypothetical protein
MQLARESHLPDERLVLYADGELSIKQTLEVRAHLMACWDCRVRMAKIEETIANFVRVYHESSDSKLQPIEGPRALLSARLAEASKNSRPKLAEWLWSGMARYALKSAAVFALLFVVVGVGLLYRQTRQRASSVYAGPLPNPTLTPGATRPATLADLCASSREDVIRRVPTQVRERVFREYGISGAPAENYEIDHLVTPGLGGSDDIRNLWPEPHYDTEWNSYVKDQLEDHLHHLVCSGQVSLDTAQHDMENNWIAAYEKYFHTDRPLLPYTSANVPINSGSFSSIAFWWDSRQAWLPWSSAALLSLSVICLALFWKVAVWYECSDWVPFQSVGLSLRRAFQYLTMLKLLALPKTARPARI